MTDLPTPATQLRAIAERLAALPEARQLDFLRQLRQKGVRLERLPLVRQATTRAPLSAAQRRLWFLWQLDPQSPAYNLPSALRLRGRLDSIALARTFAALERQHPSLRTLFETDGDQVWQRIRPPAEVTIHEVPLTAADGAAREREAREHLLAAALQPFDLAQGPLLRVSLARLAADDHLLLINVHHSIADGWSLDLLQRDFATLYASYAAGAEPDLERPPIDYSDHAHWQSLWLAAGEGERQLAFWREHLGDDDRPLALPTDRPRPPQQSYRGASRTLRLSAAEVTALRELARDADASLFMVLLAGFKAVLARFSGQGDIRVGIPVAGRTRSETREVVGLFVNTQVLHSDLAPRQSFAELLAALRRNVLAAQDHQDLPFEQVVDALRPERSLAHNPLFQVAYNHLARQVPATTLGELRLEPLHLEGEIAKFDLMLTTEEQGTDVRLVLAYATDLFEAATAERLLEHLRRLLAAACRTPQRALADLAELPAAEWTLLQGWNATAEPLPDWTLTRAFEAQVRRTPTAIAVVAGNVALDYATLNQRSNRLARLLRARGVGPEVAVGVALERTPELLVALLAVLKAGGAYVPLDPEFPTERLRLMLEDSQAALLLTQTTLLAELPATATPTWCLDREAAALDDQADTDLEWAPRAEDLAYVIYTSGSTGTPKGVAVRHGGLANFLASMARAPGLAASDRLLGLTSLSFDIAGLELYLPLLVGARVVLVSRHQARDPDLLLGEIHRQGVSVIQATPSTWRLLLEHPDFSRLEGCRLLCGGEALPAKLATRLGRQGTALWNLYGPTETTIWSAACAVTPDAPPNLGQPLANTSLWVLDAALNPVPLGAAGELYIGGAGLARGYHGRPGLTAERFVADPFGPPGARLYRTGDLARWRADGRLDYLGRLDQQVKIRGLRIELGEIEACLGALPGVREAAVVVRRQGQGQHLVGYWVDAAEVDDDRRSAVKAALAERLPDYMVPAQLVALERLPRTPNGKLDRKALPEPEWQTRALRVPATQAEIVLASIWQRVLGLEQVGLDDNFFESGGDSIVSIQVVSQAREAGWQLTPRQVFQHQTLAALAAAAQPLAPAQEQPVSERDEDTLVESAGLDPALFERAEPLSPLQLGLLYQALLAGDGTYVNQLRLDVKGLDVAAFTAAWQAALERHASLRTAFFWEGRETPLQAQRREVRLPLTLLDWRDRPTGAADLEQLAADDRQRGFALAEAPLLRLTLVRCGDDAHHLIYTNHHLLLDGWSNAQLLAEVLEQYAGGQPDAPQGQAAYRAWRDSYVPAAGEAFWRTQLAGLPAPTRLAASAPTVAGEGVAQLRLELPAAATAALVACARYQRVTLNTLLQAAWTLLLQRHTGQAAVACGVVLSGRPAEVPGIQRQLGLFINTLPLIVSPPPVQPLGEWLSALQELNLALREHEQVPLQDIQRWAGQGSDGLFDTLLVFENYPIAAALAQAPNTLSFSGVRSAELNHYPLTLMVGQGETLRLRFDYRLSHFSTAQVEGFARQLDGLLQRLPDLIDQPLGELCLLDAAECQAQVAARNQTAVAYPRTPLLPTLLAEQARRSPEALAVVHGARRLDYATFDAEANRLAHWLIAQGVGPDVRVGVAAERSVELVLALVAVLKAGGAYVPLDPDHPAERLAYQLEDSQVRLLLTQGHLQARLPASAVPQLLLDDRTAWQDQSAQAPTPALHGEHLAYVLYTSGSTGRPKGAGNTQAALLNRLHWMQDAFALGEGRRVLQKTPFSFDVSVWEFFWPLLTGATLVVADPGAHRDPRALREVIVAEEVQVLHFVPSMLQAFLAAGELARCTSLEQVICSGEALPRELQQAFHQSHGAELHNLYGPTEAAIDVSHWPCTPADEGLAVPIGRPIANLRLLVLDPWLAPVPEGVTGELYIGGAGLARGYHGRPGLTAERFVADPFEPGARLYRTGDLARWRADGALDYLGRIDHQVKIRGQRLELGEIEARLRAHPAVEDAVVVARAGEGGLQLVGYVTGAAASDELRAWLREALPDYMVPAQVLVLEAMPLSANGKLDRKALPEPDPSQRLRPYRAPTSAAERTLAPLWQRLLGVERVGLDDNFFELGGDSILSLQLVNQARQAGLEIAPRQVFELPTLAALAAASTLPQETPAAAPAQRFALLTAPLPADLDAAALDDAYPLSPMQRGMLFHVLDEPTAGLYVNQLSVCVEGLDNARFAAAWQTAVARHAVMRTAFVWEGLRDPIQVVRRQARLALREIDGRRHAPDLAALAAEDRGRPFDLGRPPLQRLTLVRLDERRQQLIWTSHHLLLDGWSAARLISEVLQAYAGEALPEVPGRYADYLAWLARQDAVAAQAFWQQRLTGATPTLLAESLPRPLGGSGHGLTFTRLDAQATQALQRFARTERITLNTLIQGAWLLLLRRYTGRSRVLFGSTVAGRPAELPGMEEVLGLFINTLPVAQVVDEHRRVGDWLRQVQQENARLRDFEHSPLYDIQRWAGQGGQALFDSIIVFENYPVDVALRQRTGAGLSFGPLQVKDETSVPMDLAVRLGETLEIEYQYLRSHFAAAAVERIRAHLEHLLFALAAAAERPLGEIEALGAGEQAALARLQGEPWRDSATSLAPQAILAQARRRPALPVLGDPERRLSWGELDERSGRLASWLQGQGVGAESRVAVALRRGVDWPVALLAIWRAGGAYVPLDASYPAERLSYQLEDAGAALLLTESALVERLPEVAGTPRVCLDRLDLATCSPCPAEPQLAPEQLAYVIYTSGSTGRPKGVAVAHGALAMHGRAIGQRYALDEATHELLFMSFAFDGAHERWIAPLMHGGRLFIRGEELWTPERTLEVLAQEAIDVAAFPPVYLQQLVARVARSGNPPPMRIYCFGGEAVPEASFREAQRVLGAAHLVNGYGPTETVVTPLLWKAAPDDACGAAYAPIGQAVGERQLYILDEALEPVPLGVAGELYIGGRGLARGYLGRPAATAERFVADPFTPGGRLYRTGDLVRAREDGLIDYVGRLDHQVKIRGFRVELGEIEACLLEHPQVREAVVDVRAALSGRQLVGYVVGEADLGVLKGWLRERLPEYLVPAQLVALERLPLTPGGKVDRRALPEPERVQDAYQAPRNDLERQLAVLWQEVLQVERVGITDNFFELGGDSILSLQLVSRIRETLGERLPLRLRDLLQQQTIAGLLARQPEQTQVAHTELSPEGTDFGLLPIQQWLFEHNTAEPNHYNQAVLLACREPLRADCLEQALRLLLERHASLRLAFRERAAGQWVQRERSMAELAPTIVEEPLVWQRQAADEDVALAIANQAQRNLDLASGRLLRAVLIDAADREQRLLLVIHHLGVDGVSWRILLDELQRLYLGLAQGEPTQLPAPSSSYRNWVQALGSHAQGAELTAELPYWLDQLAGEVVEPPRDNPRGRVSVAEAENVSLELSSEQTQALLKRAPQAHGTQINDLLLAALSRVLCRWLDSESVLIALEGHGREDLFGDLDLSRTLGWFTSLFPVRLTPGAGGLATAIPAIRDQLAAIPNRGLGFGVLRYLGAPAVQAQLRDQPQARITFNYLGQFDQSFASDAPFWPLAERAGDVYSPQAPLGNWLEIVGQVYGGRLRLRCLYSRRMFRHSTVERLMQGYREELLAVLDHCLAPVATRVAQELPA